MNEVLTIFAIEQVETYLLVDRSRPMLRVKTSGGASFVMDAKDVSGWAIGSKVRYAITLLGTEETKELDDAYVTIADLMEQARGLAVKAKRGALTQKLLAASAVANIGALLWNLLT